jgi:predicted GIY-YIG superfamily endonuclease
METLYILECEDNKWYVGKSSDVQRRFKQHTEGKGSEWTREYAPIRIVETRPITSQFDETNATKELMKKYGIENVRGGAYASIDLPEKTEELIRHEFRAASDRCYKCGKAGHFANRCTRKSSFSGSCTCGMKFLDFDEFIGHQKLCIPKQVAKKPASNNCSRCGRSGHRASSCYARTDTDGNALSDNDSDDEYTGPTYSSNTCYRCGRNGHYANNCYARRHVDGSDID